MLNLLCLVSRAEKDQLQSYLLTLSSLCEGNFEEVKNKFMEFFEAVNIYSEEQMEFYDEKLCKKMYEIKDKIDKCLKKLDKSKKGYITFDQLREFLNELNIELKESYVEYLIYKLKLKLAEDEEKEEKLNYLSYSPLIQMLNEFKFENNNEEDESSIDEEDLKENLNLMNIKTNVGIDDIVASRLDEYGDNKFIADHKLKNIDLNMSHPSQVSNVQKNQKGGEESKLFEDLELDNILSTSLIKKNNDTYQRNDTNKKIDKVEMNSSQGNEDLEISMGQFEKVNETVLIKIAQYLLSNKIKVDNLLKMIKQDDEKSIIIKGTETYMKTEVFFSLLSEIGINLDETEQYCVLIKLAVEDSEINEVDYVSINKLKIEMTNYGVFDNAPEDSTKNNNSKKFKNNFYADGSGTYTNYQINNLKVNKTSQNQNSIQKKNDIEYDENKISENKEDSNEIFNNFSYEEYNENDYN